MNNMIRTQVYLQKQQHENLNALSESTGLSQSELIRTAIEQYLEHASQASRKNRLAKARGLWSKRTDLPDFTKLRQDWDRN